MITLQQASNKLMLLKKLKAVPAQSELSILFGDSGARCNIILTFGLGSVVTEQMTEQQLTL
jgi:hypothetical protein